jgi:hypothetical protein
MDDNDSFGPTLDEFMAQANTISVLSQQFIESSEFVQNDGSIDIGSLASLYTLVSESRKILKQVEDGLSQACAARMDRRRKTIEGIGTLERHTSGGRTNWDHDGILRHLLARSRDERRIDSETGEVLESGEEALLRAIKEAAGIGYWRLEPLRRRGLDPDEFAEMKPSKPYITISS